MPRSSSEKSDSRRWFSFLRGAKQRACHSLPDAAGGGGFSENVRGETRDAQFIRGLAASAWSSRELDAGRS
jgi:hypothetical protein